MANPIVFSDMTIGGEPVGRMEMELYADECPIAAENFRALCTGEKGIGRLSKPLHYKGSSYQVSGGNIINKGENRAGESIYGDNFDVEKSVRKHDNPETMTIGLDVLNAFSTTHSYSHRPNQPVIIADCGQLINGKAYGQNMTPEAYGQ
ncbi:hypothetical protein AgCh_002281 [Apium graveolens]